MGLFDLHTGDGRPIRDTKFLNPTDRKTQGILDGLKFGDRGSLNDTPGYIGKTGNKTYFTPDSEKGSGCFITTAVCKTLQKPDNCVQLAKFRDFRDTFMQETPEMRAEVREYYELAPRICAAIDFSGEKTARERYASIWQESLKPAFEALDAGDNQKAHDLYKDMVLGLKTEFIRANDSA
jgi:hypothetical protein